MPAFWLTTEEGRKAFDEYRFAFMDKTEREWLQERRTKRQAKRIDSLFRIELEKLHQELNLLELEFGG